MNCIREHGICLNFKTLRLVLLMVLSGLFHLHCAAQKFKPDFYGYVADSNFIQEVRARKYQFVAAFDSLDLPGQPVRAIVLKHDTLKEIDLDMNEYPAHAALLAYRGQRLDSLKRIFDFNQMDVSGNYKITRSAQGKMGLVYLPTGRRILEEQYDGLLPQNNGYIYVMVNGNWGALDYNGNVDIPAQYSNIQAVGKKPFQVDYFLVGDSLADDISYLINKNNKPLTPKRYSNVGTWPGHLFWASKFNNGNPCQLLMDTLGKELTSCMPSMFYNPNLGWTFLKKKGEDGREIYTLLDGNAHLLQDSITYVDHPFEEEWPEGRTDFVCVRFLQDAKPCALDRTGAIRIPPLYNHLEYLDTDAVFIVKSFDSASGKDNFGILDSNNLVLIPVRYHLVRRITTGYFLLETVNSIWIYNLYTREQMAIPYTKGFDEQYSRFENSQLIFKDANGLEGVLDYLGRIVLPFQFKRLFRNGKYYNTDKGIFTKEGRLILKKPYQQELFFFNTGSVLLLGIFRFGETKEKTVFMDRYGNEFAISPNTKFYGENGY